MAAALILGLACGAAYAWSPTVPPISDDYIHVEVARRYAPPEGWPDLLRDALYRARATAHPLAYWKWNLFGMERAPYALFSIGLHFLNTLLVLSLGAWRVIGWRTAFFAALFFAVYEGHQEAVVWYAAIPELLVFFFSLVAFRAWVGWHQGGGASRWWLCLSAYLLALFSKESGVAIVALLALPLGWKTDRWRRSLPTLILFAAIAGLYAFSIFIAKAEHQHLNDGTFSFSAPVWLNLPHSLVRMLWIWGLIALAAIGATGAWRLQRWRRWLWLSTAWMAIGLLPYSFLTYMTRVPSRHRYLAAAGLALLVGAGMTALLRWWRAIPKPTFVHRWAPQAALAALLLHNCLYLWLYKRPQFLERARPTEVLLDAVRNTDRRVRVDCFPYPFTAAVAAVEQGARRNGATLVFGKHESCTERDFRIHILE